MKFKELPLSVYHSLRLRYKKTIPSKNTLPVIVSLTSIPSRLSTLDIVISSLLSQSQCPQQIILWLNEDLKQNLPQYLVRLEGDIFKICYCEGNSSYRKLLPSLKDYPNSIIVTCDDDMIYPKNWLSGLYQCHKNRPKDVISQVGRLITRDDNKQLKAYKNWCFLKYEYTRDNFLPVGYGGVLYPCKTFSAEVFNEELFMKLSPKADDLWFKALSFLNDKQSYCASETARPIPLLGSQTFSLRKTNIGQDANRTQWLALCEYFPKLKEIG